MTSAPRHAPRERVSWNPKSVCPYQQRFRHAPRERVSWNCYSFFQLLHPVRHAPRERVSWNTLGAEMKRTTASRSTWACELKLFLYVVLLNWPCHAPRERVSWNWFCRNFQNQRYKSRSTWACELKLYKIFLIVRCVNVTLHVSVWVEIRSYG